MNTILGKKVDAEELRIAILLLEGVPRCKNIAAALKELQENNNQPFELINRSEYIESILWSEEDIRNALEQYGYEMSQENVDKVVNRIVDSLGDRSVEAGWDVITSAIVAATKDRTLVNRHGK